MRFNRIYKMATVSNFWSKNDWNLKICAAEQEIQLKLQTQIWLRPMTGAGKKIQIEFNSAQ